MKVNLFKNEAAKLIGSDESAPKFLMIELLRFWFVSKYFSLCLWWKVCLLMYWAHIEEQFRNDLRIKWHRHFTIISLYKLVEFIGFCLKLLFNDIKYKLNFLSLK